MRIITGGVLHETSTFARGPTVVRDFETGIGIARGQEVFAKFRGANFCIGGFVEGAAKHGFELVPLLWAFAFPSGVIERASYDTLKQEFLDGVRRELTNGVDGVLLDLHGAMVVEGIDDGDGDFLASVRGVVGRNCPLIVTTDLHANHTPLRVAAADAIIGYDTYPHVDMAERGREAADLMVRTVRGDVRPVSAIRQLPLFWSAACQVTAHPPIDEAFRLIHDIERRPGILSVTLSTGFPWADVPDMGASVIVVADGDRLVAQSTADEIGEWIWSRRERWHKPPLTVSEALTLGQASGRFPIMLADMADNTGGGAPGDSTEVLRAFVDRDLSDALLLYLVDPEVAQQAHAAGVGKRLSVELGGKSDARQGPPVPLDVEVVALSDGRFRYDGPMYAGTNGDLGTSAWLRHRGVNIVVVSVRMQPLDQAFARSLGIDCSRMKFIALKSAVHFRSGFEQLGGSIFNINARAIHSHDYASLSYRRRRPMWPVDAHLPNIDAEKTNG
jgi:microcystin degradation protein MlrC